MFTDTVYSKGKDNFENYKFSSKEWSAPTTVSPEEIKNRLNSFNLVGRKIKELRLIGLSYFLTRDWIENSAYNALSKDMPEEERQIKSQYHNINPNLQLSRYSQIDEPVLIKFEDDDIFEIDTPCEPKFRFSMNCIPWFIDAGTNSPNVEANILFKPCIGKKIVEVAVDTYVSDEHPMYHQPIDENKTKYEMVSRIVLWLEGDIGISISGWVDYCEVACIDRNNNTLQITFEELKPALFNWEDIHIDNVVGFEANSCSFHFGDIGAEHTETPYMSLIPSGTDTALHIAVDDFDLFAWSMTNVLGEQFDEFDNYELSYSQWNDILNEAHKIVTFNTFDELFNYMISTSECGLRYMNCAGAEFWKHKKRYLSQYEDMKKWSALTMKPDGKMNIYGF